ncbi:ABC transporter permease [Basilea psittacipulmonis]|uniref:ABC transporter permease n=1 Tax=Basilea psittacipulmonis DSM 24701 TaxID=1072685 RepID=A0A077DH96_9BURK|nr:ABC transporter permease [Basilea psittacipulmonis]AIL32852.1 ABC transporter permease [Basilea psittacipulmonis DSM 24701]
MLTFLFKRLVQLLIVMLAISFIAFAIQQNLGDPVAQMTGLMTSAEDKALLREKLGLNDPFLVQYWNYIVGIVTHGDFGNSYFYKKPTIALIFEALPATLELVFVTAVIVIGLSIPLGIYAAIHPRNWLTKIIMGVSTIGISIPVFLTAILLLYIFSQTLGWLPSFGRGEVVEFSDGAWSTGLLTKDGILHLILPSIALSTIMLPLFIRLIRSEMMESLGQEYIRFAYAKGLPKRLIFYTHALKNTMLPVITVGGVQLGTMIAYTILTERVFEWPGLGNLFLYAINRADVPLITTYIIFVGFIFVFTNTVVDIIYGLIDPRVKNIGGKS